jgi:hypothetical protein
MKAIQSPKNFGKLLPDYTVLFLRGASCCTKLYNFSYMPAITTEMFLFYYNLFTTTCFGPYGPSSGGTP